MMDLIATVGELAFSFAVYARCLRPSAHPLPLMIPLRFFLRNMRYCSASLLSTFGHLVWALWLKNFIIMELLQFLGDRVNAGLSK
jgi:hypothetical protein